jgi:hypothetical protein
VRRAGRVADPLGDGADAHVPVVDQPMSAAGHRQCVGGSGRPMIPSIGPGGKPVLGGKRLLVPYCSHRDFLSRLRPLGLHPYLEGSVLVVC